MTVVVSSEPGESENTVLIEDSLASIASVGYQCILGTSADEIFPPKLSTGDLVWVLKSKGRRRNHLAALGSSVDEQSIATKDLSSGKGQRLELFLRARIISKPSESDQMPDQPLLCESSSRVWIQYPKGSTYCAKRDRLCRVLERERGLILVWPETDVYRKSCLTHTLPVDEGFIEIGCDHGPTVDRIASWMVTSSPLVLGIDKAADSIASARQRYPQYEFLQWDCLEPDAVVPDELQDLIQRSSSFNLAIDINGNRELPAVLSCLRRLLVDLALKPRLIFVKSRALLKYLEQRR